MFWRNRFLCEGHLHKCIPVNILASTMSHLVVFSTVLTWVNIPSRRVTPLKTMLIWNFWSLMWTTIKYTCSTTMSPSWKIWGLASLKLRHSMFNSLAENAIVKFCLPNLSRTAFVVFCSNVLCFLWCAQTGGNHFYDKS